VSKAYDFSKTGEGKYTFNAINLFHYIDESNNAVPIKADVKAHDLTLRGVLLSAVEHGLGPSGVEREEAIFNFCTPAQQSQTNPAITAARSYVFNSIR
jgi:peptidyl-Lys metalloendopeptidase